MTSSELSALLVLATVSSFTPGPNTTLSTAMAANHGLRRAMRFVCAVPVGWGILFTLCATGLGGLVVAFPPLRWGIVTLGTGYLLWLASRLWQSGSLQQADSAKLQVGFVQGVGLQFLNIKAWLLALTLVAGWIAGRADAMPRLAWVTLVDKTVATGLRAANPLQNLRVLASSAPSVRNTMADMPTPRLATMRSSSPTSSTASPGLRPRSPRWNWSRRCTSSVSE